MAGAWLFAVAVPSAMVALRLHYFTDLVGGAAVGAGTALLTALLLDTACANGWVLARVARLAPGRLVLAVRTLAGHSGAGRAGVLAFRGPVPGRACTAPRGTPRSRP